MSTVKLLRSPVYVSMYKLLPSALARGSESGIYSHKVRTYVHTWWVTLRNVTRNVVTYRIYHRY